MALRIGQTPLIIEDQITGHLRVNQSSLIIEDTSPSPGHLRITQSSLIIETAPISLGLHISQGYLIIESSPTYLVPVSGGGFQDPLGNPYANGKVTFQLSSDSFDAGLNSAISSGVIITANLDSNGVIIQPFFIWPNSLLVTASGGSTYYKVRAYNSSGQLMWFSPVVVPNNPYNIGTAVPQF